jgi:hypothetical protein
MKVFIVRPFGIKKVLTKTNQVVEFDFDKVERELIQPAMKLANLKGGTTAEVFAAGDIREDMFSSLLTADVVIADITIHNANVFYELGIRHALRNKSTVLLKCSGFEETPFDIIGYRYQNYQIEQPAAVIDSLTKTLKETINNNRTDSPVFNVLPSLQTQDPERFLALPSDFINDMRSAEAAKQGGTLALLAEEADSFDWKLAAWRLVGEAQFKLKEFRGARTTWEKIIQEKRNDLEANDRLATIYQRLAESQLTNSDLRLSLLHKSNQSIQIFLQNEKILTPSQRAEAYSLLARNYKTQWVSEWLGQTTDRRFNDAMHSSNLERAIANYRNGFYENLNHFYSGINALGLLCIKIDLAKGNGNDWINGFNSPDEAEKELTKIEDQYNSLIPVIKMSLKAESDKATQDAWLEVTKADLACLQSKNPDYVKTTYRNAIQGISPFNLDSIARQLHLYKELGIRAENVRAALSVVHPAERKSKHCLLFTGHMIDQANRTSPRFPPTKEESVRSEIQKNISKIKNQSTEEWIGIAGGACGCDIIFHEACKELGIQTHLLLPFSKSEFIRESVAFAGPEWQQRFETLYNTLVKIHLSEEDELPKWLQKQTDYTIWERNNKWLLNSALVQDYKNSRLLAVWDQKTGDGPGGTEHMINQAKDAGMLVETIDITLLY